MCRFIFNDTATSEIYTLSLHNALPIFLGRLVERRAAQERRHELPLRDRLASEHRLEDVRGGLLPARELRPDALYVVDRKSTRLNSSHANISYAAFCLKKKRTPTFSRPC